MRTFYDKEVPCTGSVYLAQVEYYSPVTLLTQAELHLSAPDEQAGRGGPAGMTEFV